MLRRLRDQLSPRIIVFFFLKKSLISPCAFPKVLKRCFVCQKSDTIDKNY